jgi:hypothetical protein
MTTESYKRPSSGINPTRFHFNINQFPDVAFQVQAATVPSVTFGVAHYDNPLQTINVPGDKLEYQPLPVTLLLDEELDAYTKIYGWMRSLGFPTMKDDLATVLQRQSILGPNVDPGMPQSDIQLILLNSNNNPVIQFTFKDAFPIYVGELQFNTTEEGLNYLTCEFEFAYNWFLVDKATT